MLFNSYIFILLFLPLTILGYFLFNRFNKPVLSHIFLILMSLWFYGYFNPWYLFIIIGSIVVNWFLAKGLLRFTAGNRKKGMFILWTGIILNLAVIGYFKYFDFFLANINSIFHQSFLLRNIILPLGISFFTFQQISFLVDSFRGETKEYNFIDYALFVCFFPQLVAGPIVLHQEIIPQFSDPERRKLNTENIGKGIYLFTVGLFKKVLVADSFAFIVNYGYGAIDTLTSMEAILVILAYTFQIYFDFSGYCDMAIGIGNMLNIDIPRNFNSPYKAMSISDFWSRWHMSLTRFLRKYVYFPLGGNRKGKWKTFRNILIVFLLSGIWHGANWTFILWGLIHGVANCIERMLGNSGVSQTGYGVYSSGYVPFLL